MQIHIDTMWINVILRFQVTEVLFDEATALGYALSEKKIQDTF